MKPIYVLSVFVLFFSAKSISQNVAPKEETSKFKKHDVSVNFLGAFFNSYEMSYEYFLNDASSIGASISYSPNIINVFELTSKEKFSFKANYRRYFSNKRTQGFFVEAYLGYSTGKYLKHDFNTHISNYKNDYNAIYVGFNIGYKYVTKNNLFFEASAGFGREVYNFNGNPNLFVPNMKLAIGKRF